MWGSAALAAAIKSGNALHGVAAAGHGPSFSYGSEANPHHETLVFPSGRAGPGWEAYPATCTFCGHSPCYGVFWGTRGRHPGQHAASIMSTRRACSGPSGAGRRKPMISEVGRGTGRPRVSAHTCAMMLMMLTGRPQRWLPRAQ